MAMLELKDLRHSYVKQPATEDDWALKQVDMRWEDGGAYALLGPSGCGKTTLLNIISGLVRPTEGRVFFGERDVTDLPTDERNIAQVFQFPVIYDTMTVYDNLAFPLRNRGVSAPEVDSRVREIAAMLDLTEMLGRRASGLTADGKQNHVRRTADGHRSSLKVAPALEIKGTSSGSRRNNDLCDP